MFDLVEVARNNPAAMFFVCVIVTAIFATWASKQF